jgi:hypothetical protein
MKIVQYSEENWKQDHPTGLVAFQHLLKGEPESPDNFMYILGRQDGDFAMPRHRHNFDQIRLPICGDMNLGGGFILREGQVGYFAEGLPYGPQNDPLGKAQPGERLQLVLQFGGASGYGFMSIEQRRVAWNELLEHGKFVGPNFQWADGRVEWGLNTIWQHVFGAKLKYARPRYKSPIIIEPDVFNWLPLPGATAGVEHKYLGAFSERGVWMEYIKVGKGAAWGSNDLRGRRLFVVLSGAGTAAGEGVSPLSAIQAEPGESLDIVAQEDMVLFLIGLPPVVIPKMESEAYDLEELPGEEVAA